MKQFGKNDDKIGVVAVVFATTNKELAESQLASYLRHATPEQYFMVYSVPLDVELTTLSHYPSIAISREDLDA